MRPLLFPFFFHGCQCFSLWGLSRHWLLQDFHSAYECRFISGTGSFICDLHVLMYVTHYLFICLFKLLQPACKSAESGIEFCRRDATRHATRQRPWSNHWALTNVFCYAVSDPNTVIIWKLIIILSYARLGADVALLNIWRKMWMSFTNNLPHLLLPLPLWVRATSHARLNRACLCAHVCVWVRTIRFW